MRRLITLFIILLFIAGCAGTQKVSKEIQFNLVQTELILSADSTAPMSVLSVYNKKDSLLLRTKSSDITPDIDDITLQYLIKRMYATVTDSITEGVGLAAPQVGILKNIIWVQRYDKPGYPFEAFLNPKIKQYTKKKLNWVEGCLSIPERRDTTTTRSYAILIEYLSPDKSYHIEMVEGFTAIIFQHEIDHLNGIFYLDRLK